jgi:four helix bundle protein
MPHKFSFEILEVWQDSRRLANMIYEHTKCFPDNEKFGLTNHMRRAAISVSLITAEGSSRISTKD